MRCLEEFRAFCDGADAVVAYNGVAHDFRLIDEEYARCTSPSLLKGSQAPRLIDALYLAQALWPIPPRQHRLKELLDRLGVDVEEMHWHDALDDSRMVVELLGTVHANSCRLSGETAPPDRLGRCRLRCLGTALHPGRQRAEACTP